jgi:hypothetical protein
LGVEQQVVQAPAVFVDVLVYETLRRDQYLRDAALADSALSGKQDQAHAGECSA